ncbi:hypothetical protein PI124_g16665 [Phytophthora idaei]|nr:hypothetical protein PI125_g17478 [Phytophthora idaei]KAG3140100.1 hypothetical protein PI126_g16172 [Phytophthora idaei]KAG3238366.1 hypothetical protein PI124_g16665 [Phytophthora idaei]
MRFNVFVALLVATFLACCSNFASAESVEDRRLQALPADKVSQIAKSTGMYIEDMLTGDALKKAVKAIQDSNGDEQAVKMAITSFTAAKEAAKMDDKRIAELSATIANTVQKNPKSWPRLKKFAKIALGGQVAGLAFYGAYKLLVGGNSATAATTTTTDSA